MHLRVAILALVLVAPTALAHAGDYTGMFSAEADGLGVYLQADRVVVKAQREIVFNGTVVSNASGRYEPIDDPEMELQAAGPGQLDLSPEPREGGFRINVTFPAPGEWEVLARVQDELRRVPIHVYPVSAVWLETNNLRSNYHYVDRPVTANLFFLDDETSYVVNATQPASGRLSRVVNETHVDTREVTLAPGPMGAVVFAERFEEPGEYVLAVASEQHGIAYGSLPEIPFRVQPPFGGASTANTPALGVLAVLALGAGLALVRRQ